MHGAAFGRPMCSPIYGYPKDLCSFNGVISSHRLYCLARYMQSPVRPSVCLSVTRVDHAKTVEVRSNFHHTVATPL